MNLDPNKYLPAHVEDFKYFNNYTETGKLCGNCCNVHSDGKQYWCSALFFFKFAVNPDGSCDNYTPKSIN